MVGDQASVCIHQYYMIVKYDLKRYADQAALPYKYQTLMYASVEALYGDIVLKFKKFPVEEGGNYIIFGSPQKFIYDFFGDVGERHVSNRVKCVINISSGGTSKVSDSNQGKLLSNFILAGLAWVFLTLLAVGADLFQYFLPPVPTWLNIHE